MCLGVPAKVLEVRDNVGKVDYGGVVREVNLSLVDAKPGEYVIVHAGYAIQKLSEEDARETLELFRQIAEAAPQKG